MRNLFKQLQDLIPQPPLQVGVVASVTAGVATVTLPGGGTLQARGTATVGQTVFVRDGLIEGQAPSLTIEVITI